MSLTLYLVLLLSRKFFGGEEERLQLQRSRSGKIIEDPARSAGG
jgi:hypothetical protein